MEIDIQIREADALQFKADVLVLKYAQALYGVDQRAYIELATSRKDVERELPAPGKFLLLETEGVLGARHVLFTGVVDIVHFRYKEIRQFAFDSLRYLSNTKPDSQHICFTLHGVHYGLDEIESFESEVAGLVDAIEQGLHPSGLKRITILEYDEPRARRLNQVLERLSPGGSFGVSEQPFLARRSADTGLLISDAGINSEKKPLIFVAMPFDRKMEDVYHYGIQNAVNRAGFLCERADMITFTGDILDLVKRRIREASLVIADLTSSNPNVYLEVGYAWGLGIPTVLIAQDAQELKFDVKGQKCIIYSSIRDLEEKLSEELLGLKKQTQHGKSP